MTREPPRFVRSSVLDCRHAFSTRLGGVSRGIWESLNLGRLDGGDDPANIAENWRLLGAAAGIDTSRFVHGRQVHGHTVLTVGASHMRGILEPGALCADGYVTKETGVPLVVFTADCAPLLMHEPEAGVAAAVHCGWRPTAADIVGEAVRAMESLGARPERIRAAIGPCIRACCFQTGPEVPEAMEAMLGGNAGDLFAPDASAPGKHRVNLPGVVARRLIQLGLAPERIDDLGECTMCQPERFWSHRRLGLRRGSQANIIVL